MMYKKGFTLIELLLVITIIGILSSIVLVSLDTARERARDVKRVLDLKQIQLGLEQYYEDCDFYPLCGGSGCAGTGGSFYCASITGYAYQLSGIPITPHYIKVIPTDPVNADQHAYYYVRGYRKISDYGVCPGNIDDYILMTRLEGVSGPNYVRRCGNCNPNSCSIIIFGNPYLNYVVGSHSD